VQQQRDHIKQHGVHYTPVELAAFLARVTYQVAKRQPGRLDILDPACGDGALLFALAEAVPKSRRRQLNLFGFEQDHDAAEEGRRVLGALGTETVTICERNFLDLNVAISPEKYDIVIANPPYVRTQVLGAITAQRLSRKFGLTGRVDLYHAFTVAMAHVLRERGVLGLLTSNRFLTIKSGISLRRFLSQHFQLRRVFDLGDTKLFEAAVLPAIVVGEKCSHPRAVAKCPFTRIYQHRQDGKAAERTSTFDHVLDAAERANFVGLAQTESGLYRVEKGVLDSSGADQVWSLSTAENAAWLARVGRHRRYSFADVAQVRVGIKTTADAVFIRDDWRSLPKQMRPEGKLVRPLITHHHAARWTVCEKYPKSVLYPHESHQGKRAPIRLATYPKAAAYLQSHAARLRSRKYVIDGGREWFEIWVPHHPDDWAKTKVVFRDISERPTFFLDQSGAVVNGDCYWITLKPEFEEAWLYLLLAVANSSFIERYYDVTFHNKLYAGRRRFMTQYVKQFPLPDLASATARKIVREVKKRLTARQQATRLRLERKIESLVWQSFGFEE
jgi:tRNA1(Val) A37 N6-methylase TrmN6